jgi:hypothetical protein
MQTQGSWIHVRTGARKADAREPTKPFTADAPSQAVRAISG